MYKRGDGHSIAFQAICDSYLNTSKFLWWSVIIYGVSRSLKQKEVTKMSLFNAFDGQASSAIV